MCTRKKFDFGVERWKHTCTKYKYTNFKGNKIKEQYVHVFATKLISLYIKKEKIRLVVITMKILFYFTLHG